MSSRGHSQAEVRSHRRIGEALDLFHVPEHSPGIASWHPRGLIVYRELERLVRELGEARGYEEVRCPSLWDWSVWERSGHAQKFSDKMFSVEVDGHRAGLRPMNCPGHAELFAQRPRSWREMPVRFSELGFVHRNEQSGEVNGLLRGRGFCIDDGHLFCREQQVPGELLGCLEMALEVYDLFSLQPRAELSLRPQVRLGDDAMWDRAERALRDALDAVGLPFDERPGEGAFYGPKIDLHVFDSLGRAWQLGSVQLDYQLAGPDRFDLSYVAEDGGPARPVIVHRALLGSFERFIGVLIEHLNGRLPLWLAPEAVRVLPVGQAHVEAANRFAGSLRQKEVRCAIDADGPLGGRVRRAAEMQIPVLAVIGDREAADGSVALRRGSYSAVFASDEAAQSLGNEVHGRRRG
ncbi:MAG: threonyl-tRNA synthetase [Solirubrobacteraceae bacterium]